MFAVPLFFLIITKQNDGGEKMKVKIRVKYLILMCIFSIMFIAGCTMKTPLQKDHFLPDIVPPQATGSQSITFTKVVYKVDDVTVGHHHDGYLRVPFHEHILSKIVPSSDYIITVLSDEMRKCGYHVIGGEQALFQKSEEENAIFKIGAIVSGLQYNTYAPLAGNFNEAYIDVEWQMFDSRKNDIIFKQKSDAYVRIEKKRIESKADDSPTTVNSEIQSAEYKLMGDPIAESFKKAFHVVLSNDGFLQNFKK
jgi:hypothetical protein